MKLVLFIAVFMVSCMKDKRKETICVVVLLEIRTSILQGSHIRIYNVDKGWKVQKNILAKSLRWTITDTSLSPDQRYLVSFCMSLCIKHMCLCLYYLI